MVPLRTRGGGPGFIIGAVVPGPHGPGPGGPPALGGWGNIGSHDPMPIGDALRLGEKWVGPGYREMGKPGTGVFRSSDGGRQFRMTDADITGGHGDAHVHFEVVEPWGDVIENLHVPLLK